MRRQGYTAPRIVLAWMALWAILSATLLRPAGVAEAHSIKDGASYVAATGVDAGKCDTPHLPCRTIRYAIDRVPRKNVEVRVAAGEYDFDPQEMDLLLSAMVKVRGGYSKADEFAVQDPARNQTVLVGPSTYYRKQLQANGFVLKQDLDGVVDVPAPPPVSKAPTARTNCVNGMAGSYPCKGIDLMARIPLSSFNALTNEASNIWGFVDLNDQREYALIGLNNGTGVVEVTDPESPRIVGMVPSTNNSSWREMKVYQVYDAQQARWNAYGYVVSDVVGSPGVQIIDLTGLPTSVSLANTYTGITKQHTIYLSNSDYATGAALPGATPYLYINGGNINRGAAQAFSLANPTNIVPVSTPPSVADYTHDSTSMLITDARTKDCRPGHNPCEIFIDYSEDKVVIWDMTDKANPLRISSTPYAGFGYTHSGWMTDDQRYIFIQDEYDEIDYGHNSRVRTMDLSSLTNPTITTSWTGPTKAIDHNGYTIGDLYYMSNYRRGLTILDVSNPLQLQEVAFFDSYPSSDTANFTGAWGVYPFLPSGTIIVSDITGGLFILRESPQAITGLQAASDSPATVGATVAFTASVGSGTDVSYSWSFGDGGTSSQQNPAHAYAAPGSYTATVTATNSLTTKAMTLTVQVGEAISGLQASSSGPALVGELVSFNASVASGSNVSYSWSFGDGGTSGQQNPTHAYATPGSYTATVTATNGLSTDTETITVQVTEAAGPANQPVYMPLIHTANGIAATVLEHQATQPWYRQIVLTLGVMAR